MRTPMYFNHEQFGELHILHAFSGVEFDVVILRFLVSQYSSALSPSA